MTHAHGSISICHLSSWRFSPSESCIRGRAPCCTPRVLNPTHQQQQSVTTFLLPSGDGSENEAENYMVEKAESFET
jgi:hypothetical protein